MILTLAADRNLLERALESSERALHNSTQLNTISDKILKGKFEEAWADYREALRLGFELGRDKARDYLNKAVDKFEDIFEQAKQESAQLHEELLSRLRNFFNELMSGILQRVPSQLQVGGQTFLLEKINTTQKLILTGAIKTNLQEIFTFTSEGELSIAADYNRQ